MNYMGESLGENFATANMGTSPPTLSTAILSDDVNLCAMLQHTLAMSRAPLFSINIVSPANCNAAVFTDHDIVFIDRIYRAQPYSQTLAEFLPAVRPTKHCVLVLLLDEYELNNDMGSIAPAIKSGVDELVLRNDLSLKHIISLLQRAAPGGAGTNPATANYRGQSAAPASSQPQQPMQQAGLQGPGGEPRPAHSFAAAESLFTHFQHQLAIDLESQRIHIEAIENSPLFNESTTLLSLQEWQARLDAEGAQRFAELLRSAIDYKTIPRSIECMVTSNDGTPVAATISDIQIKNNGQGRVVGASAELHVKMQSQAGSTAAPRAGFDNLVDHTELPAQDKSWENIARSLPLMCLLLDEQGYISRVINNDEHLNQNFPQARQGLRLSEILEIDSLDNLVETIQRTLNTGKEHQQTIAYASNQGLRWLDTYITKLKGDAGVSRQVVWTAFDITSTRHSYQELLKNNDSITQLLDDAPVLFFQKDHAGRFQRANKAFCKHFNLRADVISGRTDDEVFRDSLPGFSQLTRAALQNPGNETVQSYGEQIDGSPDTLLWRVMPITQAGGGQIESLVGFGLIDSTSAMGEQGEDNSPGNIAAFNNEPASHNLADDSGVALTGAVGRDFKSILNGIVNYTEVALAQKNKAREQRIADHLEEVVKTASHAHELVAHKASRQTNEKQTSGTPLQPLIREIVEMMRPTMPPSLNLKIDIDDDAASALIAETPFKQIVLQLLVSARSTALAAQQDDNASGENQEIVLTLSNGSLPETECSACTDTLSGDYIVLAVHTKTADVSSVDLQKLIKAAKSATRNNSADNVVAMAHNNQGHAVIEQQDDQLALQLLFKKA
ncbi:MAG: PAS domain-containing protein [Pseudomonadales bacterium]|nr:PAS domain-containing protein [Pseudomonadales bacterium]